MKNQLPRVPDQAGTKRGTATRRAGKATAARLVEAARDMLASENFERFSLRAVADRAGVSLANLQYYFPRREDLARALYLDVGERYRTAYAACLAGAPREPLARLTAVLRWNMEDITRPATRQFFIQLWAVLGSLDDFQGAYLQALYAIDIAQLAEHIQAWQAQLPDAEARQRATLMASLIEGLMLLAMDTDDDPVRQQALLDACVQTCLSIARGTPPGNPEAGQA